MFLCLKLKTYFAHVDHIHLPVKRRMNQNISDDLDQKQAYGVLWVCCKVNIDRQAEYMELHRGSCWFQK